MKPKNLSLLTSIFLSLQLAFLASCNNSNPAIDSDPALRLTGMATQNEINSINYLNSLVVVEPLAIEAASEVLSFDLLLAGFAREAGIEAVDLTSSWIDLIENPQTMNGDTAEARFAASEALALAFSDMSERIELIAISNRIDLTKFNSVSNKIESIGEVHFVYELRDEQNLPLPFTIAMEFALPISAASASSPGNDLKSWAIRWSALSRIDVGTEQYGRDLVTLVSEIATADNFLHMRTNEKIDTSSKWEFRQYSLKNGAFTTDLLPQTPSERYKETNNQGDLNTYITNNSVDFISGSHDFSRNEGVQMLGIRALSGSTWKQNSSPNDPYYIFYANTCSGCHTEVNKGGDRHIFTNVNAETELSPFLTDEIPIDAKPSKDCVPQGVFSWCVVSDEEKNVWLWNESLRRRSLLACFAAGFITCRISENSLAEESSFDSGAMVQVGVRPYR